MLLVFKQGAVIVRHVATHGSKSECQSRDTQTIAAQNLEPLGDKR